MMRGHTLLWYLQERFPAWLVDHDFGSDPAVEARRLVREHVETVCRRYGDRIYSHDVVNEAVDPATGAIRSNTLSRAVGGGPDLLDLAFRTARAELPNAQLVYNDYMSWGGGGATHRNGVLALLRGFKERGVPVDALGLQSHIGFNSALPTQAIVDARAGEWRAFLDAVVALGYDLVITELDVDDEGQPADIAARDREVAALVRGYLDIVMAYPQLRDVMVWGMSDRYSWLQSFAPRADGLPLRPLPYDAEFQPKPMRDAVAGAFADTFARTLA